MSRRIRAAQECASDVVHMHHSHDDDVTITLPASLWDSVVDSIGQDYGLTRQWEGWTYERIGFGGRYSADVPRDTAREIAQYMDSLSGLLSQTWAMDSDGRGEARRGSNAAAKTAQAIKALLI